MEVKGRLTCPEQEREKGVGNKEAKGQKWMGEATGSREVLGET